MKRISRRAFLQTASTALIASTLLGKTTAKFLLSERIPDWEYRRGGLGGPWEAWRKANDDANVWTKVEVPHCFNAFDAVDPDTPYYQGPAWYRTKIRIENPYPNGRTFLHFEGAGQKTEVYLYTDKVGSHVGGYDEFTVDITDAVTKHAKRPPNKDDKDKGLIPLAILCDNTRDLEMIPSNLSDFNLYGGLYRYLNLVYMPTVSLERIHVLSNIDAHGNASVTVRGRLYNSTGGTERSEERRVGKESRSRGS